MNRVPAVLARLALAGLLASAILIVPGTHGVPAALAESCGAGPVTIARLAGFGSSADGLDCYGGRLLSFRAWVQPPCDDGCGGAEAAVVTPLWLDGLLGSSVVLSDGPRGDQMPVFVPPALGQCSYLEILPSCPFRSYVRRWVSVSGHFDGPVAQTCRYDDPPPGPGFSRAEAIAGCRQSFIVLSVGTGSSGAPGSPPDTATITEPSPPASGFDGPADALWLAGFVTAAIVLAARSPRPRTAAAPQNSTGSDSSARSVGVGIRTIGPDTA